jgi:EAL and modified HD-GYP domain-containing signal transduction protein
MLGQKEVRKWITTAVSSEMSVDRPSEIARISLLRAKFAENMAKAFELASQIENLFLMGLFSVLDVMLEMPMEDALKYVFVPEKIREALLGGKGQYGDLHSLMMNYDTGDWYEVSRLALLKGIDVSVIGRAYSDALYWLRDFLQEADEGEA